MRSAETVRRKAKALHVAWLAANGAANLRWSVEAATARVLTSLHGRRARRRGTGTTSGRGRRSGAQRTVRRRPTYACDRSCHAHAARPGISLLRGTVIRGGGWPRGAPPAVASLPEQRRTRALQPFVFSVRSYPVTLRRNSFALRANLAARLVSCAVCALQRMCTAERPTVHASRACTHTRLCASSALPDLDATQPPSA